MSPNTTKVCTGSTSAHYKNNIISTTAYGTFYADDTIDGLQTIDR